MPRGVRTRRRGAPPATEASGRRPRAEEPGRETGDGRTVARRRAPWPRWSPARPKSARERRVDARTREAHRAASEGWRVPPRVCSPPMPAGRGGRFLVRRRTYPGQRRIALKVGFDVEGSQHSLTPVTAADLLARSRAIFRRFGPHGWCPFRPGRSDALVTLVSVPSPSTQLPQCDGERPCEPPDLRWCRAGP